VLNFNQQDSSNVETLTKNLDTEIIDLNNELYALQSSMKRIESSLDAKAIPFEVLKAKQLFEDCGITFPNQLKKNFESLLEFNRIITQERNEYLKSDLIDIESRLEVIKKTLVSKHLERSALISDLNETDVFKKYRVLSDEIAKETSILFQLENEKKLYNEFLAVQTTRVELGSKLNSLQNDIKNEVNNPTRQKVFEEITIEFNTIVQRILNIQAVISASINKEMNIEFTERLLNEKGIETLQDDGHTYKKFLCIAFDLALLHVHHTSNFFRMVFHDGPFEALDNRMKLNLLEVMREYADEGIQQIITVIDSDVPQSVFKSEEVILRLNDSGMQGRLFKMQSW
jgi:uncharacterized protein YydD (DUF2326 family)